MRNFMRNFFVDISVEYLQSSSHSIFISRYFSWLVKNFFGVFNFSDWGEDGDGGGVVRDW